MNNNDKILLVTSGCILLIIFLNYIIYSRFFNLISPIPMCAAPAATETAVSATLATSSEVPTTTSATFGIRGKSLEISGTGIGMTNSTSRSVRRRDKYNVKM